MRIQFRDRKLSDLYTTGKGAARWLTQIVNRFIQRVRHIEAAQNEQDLRIPPSVHYEQLKGDYGGKDSLRLNKKWRLIISIEEDAEGKYVAIHEINKHYGD